MGHKQYLKVGQNAKNRLFGVAPKGQRRMENGTPLNMLISEQGKISTGKLAVLVVGLFTLVLGIILSSIPWLDYIILKHLRLTNSSLSYHYWQRPGVVRLTKIYFFNLTNPEGFEINQEKPKLVEVGPYVYREDMEKVNIKFHDNGSVTFQHNKILKFVPELSTGKKEDKITGLNIPAITLATFATELPSLPFVKTIAFQVANSVLAFTNSKLIIQKTPEELVFGYDDHITYAANKFFPINYKPNKQMGLMLRRNGTLKEIYTIFTGHTSMNDFGLFNRIDGLDYLQSWPKPPCNSIRASEGSFFPPRDFTKADVVHVYDKDLCRTLPLQYRGEVTEFGVKAGFYSPTDDALENAEKNNDNKCFCYEYGSYCPPKGLQSIRPCHFDAPVYLSYPHFLNADPSLLTAVEGLKPDVEKHQTYFKIQHKLGVPLEGKVRVQMNLKIAKMPRIRLTSKMPEIVFPIMWLEEGVQELSPAIKRWIYLSTTFSDTVVPLFTYGCICVGASILIFIFVKAYKSLLFYDSRIERGKERLTRELTEIRRGSSFLVNGQSKLLILRDSYSLLDNINGDLDNESGSLDV